MIGLHFSRIVAIARKEVAHVSRDPFTVVLALGLPLITTLIFGFAIEFNIQQLPTAYVDADHTQLSRRLVETYGSSNYFQMQPTTHVVEAMRRIEAQEVRAAMIIPPDFEKNLVSGRGAEVQVLIDGADNSTVGAVSGYVSQLQRLTIHRLVDAKISEPIAVKTRFLYNSELISKWFVVPGLIVVIMAILSILLTALTVAREWENGSMELLLSTPVQPLELIIGKLAPYGILGLGGVALVYLMARTIFAVPFVGNHFIFLAGTILFLVTYLAQGLLISVSTRKQALAMQLSMMTGLLPSQLLSGFIFPIESMPKFFQYFTMILPARWFMIIARDSFLQGSTLWSLRVPFLALGAIATLFITLSIKKFKKDLEP
jgi:ABC-2 type transport system permease protein